MVATLGLILALAVLVESLIENFGQTLDKNIKLWVSAALGVVVCLAYGADLLALLGYNSPYPFVGQVITGFIVGRGSNFVNGTINRVRNPQVAELHTQVAEFSTVKVEGDSTNVEVDKQPKS